MGNMRFLVFCCVADSFLYLLNVNKIKRFDELMKYNNLKPSINALIIFLPFIPGLLFD